ncbi:MAG: hypothetical protein ABIR37_00945 [Candidatus Saccharimonadales bacterium]
MTKSYEYPEEFHDPRTFIDPENFFVAAPERTKHPRDEADEEAEWKSRVAFFLKEDIVVFHEQEG